jgi:ethanolamine utilization protein EutN
VYLARVVGTVVASVKAEGLEGAKLLLVQPLGRDDRPSGEPLVACDQAQAGVGDRVLCVSSREAALAMPDTFVPVDAAIIGVADRVDREGTP